MSSERRGAIVSPPKTALLELDGRVSAWIALRCASLEFISCLSLASKP